MATFFDLPKPLREKIYRLHLVRESSVDMKLHAKIANYRFGVSSRFAPALLAVSRKAEREAAPIYYGENHFDLGEIGYAGGFGGFGYQTYTRHLRLIRKVTCTWRGTNAGNGFAVIARMTRLQELYIRVNEAEMARDMTRSRSNNRHTIGWWNREPSAQEQLSVMKHPGYTGLLKISGVPHVEFIKTLDCWREEREIVSASIGLEDESFSFLSLPSELRNRVYDLVLSVPGRIRPTTDPPTSAPKKLPNQEATRPKESVLSLLAPKPSTPGFVCDLTLYYYNGKSGGINLAELTFPMLKQLPGLRRLEVILNADLSCEIRRHRWWINPGWQISAKANPVSVQGLKVLFTLRGLTEIKVRDLKLERDLGDAKKDKEFPLFSPRSRSACVVKLAKILNHFNKALSDAQLGELNKKVLGDPEWHLMEDFPIVDADDEKGE